jgi:hypothetical protein
MQDALARTLTTFQPMGTTSSSIRLVSIGNVVVNQSLLKPLSLATE